MARVTTVTSAKRYTLLLRNRVASADQSKGAGVTSQKDNKISSVTWCNIRCNMGVTVCPGKGRECNVEGISPFRGIPDVTPMPRASGGE